jgi:hypothetical protein
MQLRAFPESSLKNKGKPRNPQSSARSRIAGEKKRERNFEVEMERREQKDKVVVVPQSRSTRGAEYNAQAGSRAAPRRAPARATRAASRRPRTAGGLREQRVELVVLVVLVVVEGVARLQRWRHGRIHIWQRRWVWGGVMGKERAGH